MRMVRVREEQGVVIAVDGDRAKVKIRRSPACAGCSDERMCGLFGKDETVLTAQNQVGACNGQKVCVSFKVEGEVKASLILYLFPLVALVVGALIGNHLQILGDKEISGAIFGFLFVILAFITIKYYNHVKYSQDQSYNPTITKVVA